MALRVGVIGGGFGGRDATVGGGWTLTSLLREALKDFPTSHQFILLDDIAAQYGFGGRHGLRGVAAVVLARAQKLLKEAVEARRAGSPATITRALDNFRQLDIIWFMSPPGFPSSMPYIATVWDLEHRKQPHFPEVGGTGRTWSAREEAYRSVLPRASYVITGTEVGKTEIAQFYGVSTKNIKVIPFPAPCDLRSPVMGETPLAQNLQQKGDFLFYPAQFWSHKNHVNLLRALDLLRTQHGVRLNLALTGSDKGNRDHVRRRVDDVGLQEQVFDLDFVSREELAALYLKAFALVYPSFFGPDNLPPLEAFAMGCPVIAANVAGAGEQLGDAALLFDPSDAADLAVKILRLREDNACRQRLIARGAAIAAERTPRAYLARLCELLDEFEPIRRCWGERFGHL
jgi:glycosyltransferase involved in cell wall biosynthesis